MTKDNNSNNFNNERNDMDDFFAQFDAPANNRSSSSRSSSDSVAAGRSRSNKGASSGRSGRAERNAKNSTKNSRRRDSASVSKNRRNDKTGKTSGKRNAVHIVLLAILATVMGVGIYAGTIIMSAPGIKTDNIYDQLNQRSIMYDSAGKEIENLYMSDGNRTIVKYDDIPEDMVNAVVSIEDRTFWEHSGFNYIRMLGAIKESISGGGQISGTSTVTQQLARNIYLADRKSVRDIGRKITEAYYTIILEKNLSKEQIMEAYLNSIYFGFNSYGIQAASQSYFSKDVKDMDTLECAALASLPASPNYYALIMADYFNSGLSLPVISKSDSVSYLYNGDLSKDRRDLVLRNMASEGYITSEQLDAALNDDLSKHMKLGITANASTSSYFIDYVVEQLTKDIVSEYGMDRSEAQQMIYTSGLQIYTTMDSDIQNIVDEEFNNDSNFAGLSYVRTDSEENLLNTDGNVLLRSYSYYFNDNDEFTLNNDEYDFDDEGNMTIYKGKRLNIYETEVNGAPDVSIEFKGMYVRTDTGFYTIESGALSIPQGYKKIDSNGNAVVLASFFNDKNYKDFFKEEGDSYVVSSDNYSLKQKIQQPQAAMTIIENATGEIKAMIGGRGTTGRQLFNRATTPNQPGSSIKPIGIYGPALQMSYEYSVENKTMSLDTSDGSSWGNYITAGSIINDAPMTYGGRTWPKNAYSGYRGHMRLRTAVEQSVNVCAVKTYLQIGPDYSASMLKKNGITTLDEEGDVNDLNPAALALGGLTNGATTLEMASAYSTFPNGGIHKSPIAYTKVYDSHGELKLENISKEERVYNEGVAWIMTDILRTVVTNGIAGSAAISSQPVGGKTGTTDDNFDIWFCGFTPQYSAALWMGTDVNIQLSSGSGTTAAFWSAVMGRVCENIPYASFRARPDNVIAAGGEYYVDGTYSRTYVRRSKSTNTTKSTTETTNPPTTQAPTTKPPTTQPPTTQPPTTQPPTTEAPTTEAPTTEEPAPSSDE